MLLLTLVSGSRDDLVLCTKGVAADVVVVVVVRQPVELKRAVGIAVAVVVVDLLWLLLLLRHSCSSLRYSGCEEATTLPAAWFDCLADDGSSTVDRRFIALCLALSSRVRRSHGSRLSEAERCARRGWCHSAAGAEGCECCVNGRYDCDCGAATTATTATPPPPLFVAGEIGGNFSLER